jgi:hypothetical protein
MPLTIQVFIPDGETTATLTAITGTGTASNPYTITQQGSSQFGTIEVADLANLLGLWQWKVGTRAVGRVLIVAGQTDYPIQSSQQAAAAAIAAAGLPTAALVSGEIASDVEQGLNGWDAASAILVAGLATSSNVTDARDSILNRIGAFAGTGANTILGFLRAVMRKDVSAPSEVGGDYDPATDSQEAIAEAVGDIEGGGGGLTGDFNLTVTVTDADTSQPIENATVTLSRTGERGAELTNASGVAVVGLDAATWSWIVRAAGYESRTGTVVVSGDQALSVALDGIVVAVPADAPLCAVTLPVVDQYGVRIAGVSVAFKFAGLQPNADPGAVIMSPPPPQTSDGSGVVQVNLIRLARYTATYKHDGETRNIAIAVPDAGSFVVVEG